MPRDGSGGHSLPAGNPVVTGTAISSTVHNNTMTDLSDALEASIAKNGETVITGDLDFNGNDLIIDIDGDTKFGELNDDVLFWSFEGSNGLFAGHGTGNTGAFLHVDPGAKSVTAATSFGRLRVGNTAAITVPAGVTSVVASLFIEEPNLTATGTITKAATAYIEAAPTEGGSNYALYVDDGAVLIDSTLEVGTRITCDAYAGDPFMFVNGFRLSLTTALAVTTSDVNAAGTLYLTPYTGNQISVFTGTEWRTITQAELSIAVSSTAARPFDIFYDYNAGTPVLAKTDWTNDTTRATSLTTQDGRLVQTGNTDWLYVGTARTVTASQVTDSVLLRHLFNYYNRVERPMRKIEGTDSWTYTTATIRQSRADATNQLSWVQGISEEPVKIRAMSISANDTGGVANYTGIGIDTTTVFTSQSGGLNGYQATSVAGRPQEINAVWEGFPGIGYHYGAWLEYSAATGTTTWFGDAGALLMQTGIIGSVMA